MGHSPRVVEGQAALRRQREWAELMQAHTPQGLTPEEVNLADHPLTRAPHLRPVLAWVRYNHRPVQVKGFTTMWTDTAVKVRWWTPGFEWHEAWVWEGAVESRPMQPEEANGPKVGVSINAAPVGSERRTGFL